MTTAERSAAIRKELKAKRGWTSKDVSVVTDEYSMGSSIRIKIKNPPFLLRATGQAVVDGTSFLHRSIPEWTAWGTTSWWPW